MNPDRIKQNSIKYFDSLAQEDIIIPEPVMCYEAVMKELESYEFTVLADIGCGTGEMLGRILERYGEKKTLFGVDISPKSIDKAKDTIGERAELLTGDVENLPLEDSSVDIVLNMHSFHHYPNPGKSLREMRRVLRDGGYLLMVENNYSTLRRIEGNLYHILRRHNQGDVKMYSCKELKKMMQEAGLDVILTKPMADHSMLYICHK